MLIRRPVPHSGKTEKTKGLLSKSLARRSKGEYANK